MRGEAMLLVLLRARRRALLRGSAQGLFGRHAHEDERDEQEPHFVIVPPPSRGLQMARIAALAVCLAAAGCKKAPPPQPRFCDQDLSGLWLNSSDWHFAYRF